MFSVHGEFVVTRQGNLLLAQVSGSWNAETALAYADAIEEAIEPIKDDLWAIICNVELWELSTPDCHQLMVKLAAEYRAKGFSREAVVNSNIDSVKLDLFNRNSKKEPKKASKSEFQRRFFETDGAAREWLESEGYGLE